ncbi:MAG TPA: acyl-CoA dehydrogenase family protein [Myxococcota bacterium]|nr:acyl-CoA dehydrogenase family protein [Myxococcota bacterium]
MSELAQEVEPNEIAEFRREVRAWMEANKPADPGFKLPQSFLEVESDRQFEFLRDWQRKVFDAGYLGLDWPAEFGGKGDPLKRQRIVSQELSRARAPFLVNVIGLQWAGPTILHYGTDAQKKRYLKSILSAEEIWCQGFSEPGAGSDLASATTRAERTAEGWCVTGHKVWTTLAHKSKWMILLARTDPRAGKYEGLSYFLFPMDATGVTVQPLVKMTGEGGFNQVIFDNAPMGRAALLGQEGQGWQVAMTTLLFERGAAEGSGGGQATSSAESVQRLASLAKRARRAGGSAAEDPVLRDRAVQLWIEEEALRLASLRARIPGLNLDRPQALRLMNKLVYSEFNQRLSELACEMLGPASTLWLGDLHAVDRAEWPRAYMNSFGMTIGGGTSEIQRNILGERVLGLPKSK